MQQVATLRLTAENVIEKLLPGDSFADDASLAPVKSVRLTRDGFDNAMVYFLDGSSDILGLPQTVKVTRDN